MRKTAILLALACAFARADYGPGTTDSDLLRSGTPVVTNAWLAVSNETVRIARSVAGDAGAITDGTNRIDATRDVWRMYSGRVCTNANEAWIYVVTGQTYTASQMADLFGNGDEGYSRTLTWTDGNFFDPQGEVVEFEGWYVQDGSGSAPVGYNYSTGEIPDYATDHFLAEVSYYTEPAITAFRGTFVNVTNYVGRLALTNDIPTVTSLDFTTNNAQLVATIEAKAPAPGNYLAVSNAAMNAIQSLEDATNYTDAVAAEFEDGLRSPQYAGNSGHADYAVELYGEMAKRSYTATDLIRASTNAAISVADAKISTNNAAFVSAVTNCPLVIASTNQVGGVKVDGTSVTITDGAISSHIDPLNKMWEFRLSDGGGATAKAVGRIIGVSDNTAIVYCQLKDTSHTEWSSYISYYLFSMVIDFNSDAYTAISSVTDGSTFAGVVATLYFADAYTIMQGDKPNTTEIEYYTVVFKNVPASN